ncbi:hypothetical protein ACE4RV_15885 [Acetobacter persici]|uniref:hypothetical protein n=1 Tax=Acetobacter persici TaxID=1076596 RepID=UPI0036DA2CCB
MFFLLLGASIIFILLSILGFIYAFSKKITDSLFEDLLNDTSGFLFIFALLGKLWLWICKKNFKLKHYYKIFRFTSFIFGFICIFLAIMIWFVNWKFVMEIIKKPLF